MSSIHSEKKDDIAHVDAAIKDDNVLATLEGHALSKSRFDELSIPRTLWVFRRTILILRLAFSFGFPLFFLYWNFRGLLG